MKDFASVIKIIKKELILRKFCIENFASYRLENNKNKNLLITSP